MQMLENEGFQFSSVQYSFKILQSKISLPDSMSELVC